MLFQLTSVDFYFCGASLTSVDPFLTDVRFLRKFKIFYACFLHRMTCTAGTVPHTTRRHDIYINGAEKKHSLFTKRIISKVCGAGLRQEAKKRSIPRIIKF